VKPEDAARAVRGALLFGAILPELKGEAARLTRELAELEAVRHRIAETRIQVSTHLASLAPARKELRRLLDRKKQLFAKTASELEEEDRRTKELASQAKDVRELLARLAEERRKAEKLARKKERERKLAEQMARRLAAKRAAERKAAEALAAKLAAEQRAAEQRAAEELAAKRAAEQRAAEQRAAELAARQQAEEETRRLAALAEQKRLEAREKRNSKPVRFAESIGELKYPAQGETVRNFGDKNGFGGRSEGLFIATRKLAQITTPADGRIEFAGEFRSYGKLVILDAGDGYHLLFAGLNTISVSTGQILTAGEPVGTMGEHPARATLIGDRIDDPRPILYVEVRKGPTAIDSSKWWIDGGNKAVLRPSQGANEG
jgi:septal ring factor EnvC (AmiA/AmiB activator)